MLPMLWQCKDTMQKTKTESEQHANINLKKIFAACVECSKSVTYEVRCSVIDRTLS